VDCAWRRAHDTLHFQETGEVTSDSGNLLLADDRVVCPDLLQCVSRAADQRFRMAGAHFYGLVQCVFGLELLVGLQ